LTCRLKRWWRSPLFLIKQDFYAHPLCARILACRPKYGLEISLNRFGPIEPARLMAI